MKVIYREGAKSMEGTFLTGLKILNVRHLHDIEIALSGESRKNLILTGKNGSGKTSVLKSIAKHLEYVISSSYEPEEITRERLSLCRDRFSKCDDSEAGRIKKGEYRNEITTILQESLTHWTDGAVVSCTSAALLREKYQNGQFVLAYYSDDRKISVTDYKNIEKVQLKLVYKISDRPSQDLGKYLVNLKSTQAFAQAKGDFQRAEQIEDWFRRFENVLRRIYQDDSLKLDFDIDTFQFSILVNGREPFTFNTMSMGYAAVFDIVSDLMLRMESQRRYDLEGIVLIDEIETHLHVALQKEIVPILVELFPNIQFILTTHSPFILNSTPNAVVYDLENRCRVADGLTDLPYEGIVEGYFNVDLLSRELREKFEAYKRLVHSQALTDSDYAKIAELEYYLDEIPDYLAVDFSEEYSRLKTEFRNR